ncbi:MAG TPA: methyltransferase domain-containing protein [Gemmataceae bacterium]|jgi:SAM-dependent methyltransferase|nr:methyltransferase domain-containing protein [Gemmataceae bacterium]
MWDLFGQALEAFHERGACAPYLWRRDDNTACEEPIAFYFASLEQWRVQELSALEMVAGRVLDAGCGAGKHVLEFQCRGLETVGIEVSPGALRVSRARGGRDILLMDLFALEFPPDCFDCITLFTNNLSLGGTPEGVTRLLRGLAAVLRRGGRVVLTNLDVTRSGTAADRAYQAANVAAGRFSGQIRMRAEYAGQLGGWIDWLFVTPAELEALAAPSGWRVDQVVDCGGPYCACLVRK